MTAEIAGLDRAVVSDEVAAGIAQALLAGALPGELDGFDEAARSAAGAFVAATATRRAGGAAAIAIESVSGDSVHRRMRIAVVNDDMPFLVDSVAGALAAAGIAIDRLLHPIVAVRRDGGGGLSGIIAGDAPGERRESMIYIEASRADARVRRELERTLEAVLAEVRAAVADWPRLQLALRDAASRLPDGEGAALLRWFVDGKLTMLGMHIEQRDGTGGEALGILRHADRALWPDEARAAAFAWFEQGGDAPLLLKSDCEARVHRRAPLDMIVLPVRDAGGLRALSVHVGLWTSAALRSPSEKVPVLRARLASIEEHYGFDPSGHAGKALRHALSALPHDLLIGLSSEALREVALTAMSLADRPRPKLALVPGALGRHLFAFVWLPREALTTARREAIRAMLEQAAGARTSSWALELGEGDLALVRYTLDRPAGASMPDAAAIDAGIEAMLRGWAPALETALGRAAGAQRAVRLTLDWAGAFPPAYRDATGAAEAAEDVLRLARLPGDGGREVRICGGNGGNRLSLKTYRRGGLIPLSQAVPVFENFGFTVLEEHPTALIGDDAGFIHEFMLELPTDDTVDSVLAAADRIEAAIAAVLEGRAENDALNALMIEADLAAGDILLFRAWFRYLRQTGLAYGLQTVAAALGNAPAVAAAIIRLFESRLGPAAGDISDQQSGRNEEDRLAALDAALAAVVSIEDDRILRRFRALVLAMVRTNAFAPDAAEALAFKLDPTLVPGLPKPLPWREIWVYSPRVEGVHLRGGPIARGGLRWSDRRDDFRTEILGLMKAQVVKNAVIVPTGAKGGFYPKQLPSPAQRDAWLAEGTESYRIFIRALLSVTDNLVEGAVTHPEGVTIRDGDDPYFVVAADKGTATFSDVANAIAVERGFWLGDAFASGGSHGYDHKAMGITARGAWVSVQRHFAEMGIDVQRDPVTVIGCGDMSGDVFGNGMLLSESIRLLAAFDHRHVFLDPNPDATASWAERKRMFALPRSSWADYDAALISPGGGIFPRTQKTIPISPEVGAALGIADAALDPSALIAAILKAPADLLWFGGIGTYVKAPGESNADVGDTANDAHRVDGNEVSARVIGEGANLGVTQAGRIAFSLAGGRINTDFIDNSAGVDCSDNEVNIKIALNREMSEGRLSFEDRNAFLGDMTDDVAAIVLEDNRLQTLGLSLAEHGGAGALPAQARVIEILEAAGRIDRKVDGLAATDLLLRRATDGQGLTRPELAVISSHGKLALQAAIEASGIAADPLFAPMLAAAFPPAMRARFAEAIAAHRLRGEIIATKLANLTVNRLGLAAPFEVAEQEGAAIAQVASAYAAVDRLFGLDALFAAIEAAAVGEETRLLLLQTTGHAARLHIADLIRAMPDAAGPGEMVAAVADGIDRQSDALDSLLRQEARTGGEALRVHLVDAGAAPELAARIVRLFVLDGAIGTAALSRRLGADPVTITHAYVRLGEALGLDWAKAAALRYQPVDAWDRLLAAGLTRDFEQLRLEFLARMGGSHPVAAVEAWLEAHRARIEQYSALVDRARLSPTGGIAMLAQLAGQARALLAR